MKAKICAATLLLSSISLAYATELHSYQQIKDALLNGATVKAIIDLKNDCTLVDQKGDEPQTRSNIIGMKVREFVISESNGNILTGFNLTNAPRDAFPANYNNMEVAITPDSKVNLAFKIVTLGDYKVIKSVDHTCVIHGSGKAGVKFYRV